MAHLVPAKKLAVPKYRIICKFMHGDADFYTEEAMFILNDEQTAISRFKQLKAIADLLHGGITRKELVQHLDMSLKWNTDAAEALIEDQAFAGSRQLAQIEEVKIFLGNEEMRVVDD